MLFQIKISIQVMESNKKLNYYEETSGREFYRMPDHPPQIFFHALWILFFVCFSRNFFKTQAFLGTYVHRQHVQLLSRVTGLHVLLLTAFG